MYIRHVNMELYSIYLVYRWIQEIIHQYHIVEEKLSYIGGLVSRAWDSVSDEVYSHPPIAHLLALTHSWREASQQLLTHLSNNGQLHQLVNSVLSRLDVTTATLLRLVDAVMNQRSLLSYSLDLRPEVGYLSYSQTLPIHWYRLQDQPQLMELFTWGETSSQQVDINKFYLDMHDLIRSVMAVVATRTLLPPFSATAMLMGDNHIRTFDQRFYTFSGDCSYVLTSDFGRNQFSVVGNYRQGRRESLRVLIEGQVIDLQRDGRLSVNGNRVDLPLIVGQTYLRQEGRRVILHSRQGLLLDCNTVQNICTVKLSGWYFGRTGGLLGVYDNEPSNDWMTADRQIVDDLDSFVRSWQVGSCRENTALAAAAAESPVLPHLNLTAWDREKCADLFGDPERSLLLPCMATVNPQPYHQLCLQQMAAQRQGAASSTTVAAAFCLVAAAYTEDCRCNGVEISVPGECVMCSAPPNAPLRGGESVSYQGNAARSADIVFVVEQDPCMQQLRFRSLVPLIESSLAEVGIVGNHYALVGFGGKSELVDPHTFTSASKEFNDAKGILQAFAR